MKRPRYRYCPVCWQSLGPATTGGHIGAHWDSIGRDVCPMTGQDYNLAGTGRRRLVVVREWVEPEPVAEPASDLAIEVRLRRLESLVTA